jgi:hypothetical protein
METVMKRLLSADLILTAALFLLGAVIGATYVLTWGSTALYYQNLFGPGAMYASGRGYVNPDLAAAPKLLDFLDVTREINESRPPDVPTFSPEDLPDEVPLLPFNAIQRRQLYLIRSVGIIWRIFGISWSSVAVLQGLLYGLTCAAAYGLFRVGMPRAMAVALTLLFMTSPIHLEYLPALRDYSKAPFIIGAAFLTCLVLRRSMTARTLALVAGSCGALLGIGTGFRVDVIVCLPIFMGCCLLFLPCDLKGTARKRLLAAALCAGMFLLFSFPVLVQLGDGGNKGHPALLGFMKPYSHRLGVGGVPYELGHRFLDIEPLTMVNARILGESPGIVPVIYETPVYEVAASRHTWQFVSTFPADVLIRSYAATLRVLDELRAGPQHAVPHGVESRFLRSVFTVRERAERLLLTRTRYVAALALLILAGRSLRLGFAGFGLLMWFAGYSAVQYGSRNAFHLQVIPLWVTGFVLSIAIDRAFHWKRDGFPLPTRREARIVATRVAVFTACAIALLVAPLAVAMAYQQQAVSGMLHAYLDAEVETLPLSVHETENGKTHVVLPILGDCEAGPGLPCFAAETLLLEFAPSGRDTKVTLRYTANAFETDLTRTEVIPASDGVTRLFTPVYRGSWTEYLRHWTRFEHIEIPRNDLARLQSVSRVTNPEAIPLVLHVLYTPGWELRPLYQRFTR